MPGPRRRLFGPLFYSTLVLAVLVLIYAAALQAPDWLAARSRGIAEREEVEVMTLALRSPDRAMSEQAAGVLLTKGPDVFWPIMREAARDPNGEVRALACQHLATAWGHPMEVVPILIGGAGDREELVRLEAARGLGRMIEALSAGAGLQDDARRSLRRLLKDPSGQVRAEAASSLGSFGRDPAIVADLTAATEEDDRNVRLAASQSLIQVSGPDDPAAARALIAMVAVPDAVADRRDVLRAIRSMSRPVQDRASAALAGLLGRADPDILPDLLAALGETGAWAKPIVPALEALLDHKEPDVRARAAMAIVAIERSDEARDLQAGVPGAGGAMMAAMVSVTPKPNLPPPSPRMVTVLARIVGDAMVPTELRQNALLLTRTAGASAVAQATSALVRQLAHPDPAVRRVALNLLSQIIDVAPAAMPSASGAK